MTSPDPNSKPNSEPNSKPMPPGGDSPPSRLISSFLHKQKASGEVFLDIDFAVDDDSNPNPPDSLRRRPVNTSPSPSTSSDEDRAIAADEVVTCTGNFLRSKTTKSRLMDPPPRPPPARVSSRYVSRSRPMRSGMLSGPAGESSPDEDDPFAAEDLPEEFRKSKWGFWTVVQWASLLLILAALACSLTIPFLQKKKVWDMELWKWEVLVLVLICGRLVSGWIVWITVFFFERNFLLRKKVLYFVYGIRNVTQNSLWVGLVLLAWHLMFDTKVERETNSKVLPYVTKVIVCLLVATIIRLVKTLLLKVLASSFHVSAYFDRIQESLFNQYVVQTLSGPPVFEERIASQENKMMADEVLKLQNAGAKVPADLKDTIMRNKSGNVCGNRGEIERGSPHVNSFKFPTTPKKNVSKDQGITIEHIHKLNQKNVSAWNMKRLINTVRYGSLATLHEQITSAAPEDESSMQIRSEIEAKAAAKRIFKNVARPGSRYIYLVDLMRFMPENEAIKTMSFFDGAQETDRISKSSLKTWLINAFRERKALSLTLNDTKTAVKKLQQMVNVVIAVIVVVIWLLILEIATTRFLVLISSQLLLVVFIFGNTCKTVFESVVFLFVTHPFDVGDRCEVEGVQMFVEEMNIMSTVFLKFDNLKIIYPNCVLSQKPIANLYRSPDMGDAIDFCIHVSTPPEKVALLKERIKASIEGKAEYWYPAPIIVIRDVEDMNRMKISVWFQHRMNHQDMGERFRRRDLVVQDIIKIARDLEIEYRMLPLDVNLRSMPALPSSRFPSTWTTCS